MQQNYSEIEIYLGQIEINYVYPRNGGESNLQAREFNQRLNVMLNCCKFIWRGLQVPNMDLFFFYPISETDNLEKNY